MGPRLYTFETELSSAPFFPQSVNWDTVFDVIFLGKDGDVSIVQGTVSWSKQVIRIPSGINLHILLTFS